MPKANGILFCGGGTGGHVLPGLAVANALRDSGLTGLRWIGDPERIEAKLVPAERISLLPLGLRRPRLWHPGWLAHAMCTAWGVWRELSQRPPRAIIALGGYASLIPGLLAPLLGRPLVVMEQNATPGRTNRLLARFAARTVTQFAEARSLLPAARVRHLGNPVRAITCRERGMQPEFTVLVVGGSLAARTLNDLVALAANQLKLVANLRLIHIAGDEDRARITSIYATAGLQAEVLGFVADMPKLYDRIDLAVTRAGATTVAELCAAGIPALYIPLPWAADDHQTANARAVTTTGGALLLAQMSTRPEQVASIIATLSADRPRVTAMGHAAATLARPDAAVRVAKLIQRLIAPRRPGKSASRSAWRSILAQPQSTPNRHLQ